MFTMIRKHAKKLSLLAAMLAAAPIYAQTQQTLKGCIWYSPEGYVVNLRKIPAMKYENPWLTAYLYDRPINVRTSETQAQKVIATFVECAE